VNRGTRLAVDTVAALAIGAAGVAWGVHVVDGRADVTSIAPGDRVEAAVDALRTDDVYVPPDGRRMLAEDAEQRLEQVIADAPVPVHVVVWRASDQAGGEPYSFTLPEMIAEELGEPGIYVVWQGPGDADADTAAGTRIDYGGPDLEAAGDAELRITEFVEQLEEDSLIEDDEFDYWGGRGGGFAAGLMFGGGIALSAWVLVGIARAVTGRPFRNRPRSAS
jgi:hypothetical protein